MPIPLPPPVRMTQSTSPATVQGKVGMTVDIWLSEALIREIIVDRVPPGQPLREQEIADRYRVSRPSVREALRLMAHAGFVEIQPWRGARVVDMSFLQFLDILSLLADIYARCASLAAARIGDSALAELQRSFDETVLVRTTATREELYRFSFRFGAIVGQQAGSAFIDLMLQQVGRLALWQQRLLVPGTPESEGRSMDVHALLMAALRARQPQLAGEAARTIVEITRQSLLERESEHIKIV
jgi:GntR family transcriptional regulator, rspAB operon transcriptional repressor